MESSKNSGPRQRELVADPDTLTAIDDFVTALARFAVARRLKRQRGSNGQALVKTAPEDGDLSPEDPDGADAEDG